VWKLYERSKSPFVTRNKALRWNRRIGLLTHKLGPGKGCEADITSQPLYLLGWVGFEASVFGNGNFCA